MRSLCDLGCEEPVDGCVGMRFRGRRLGRCSGLFSSYDDTYYAITCLRLTSCVYDFMK